MTTLTSTGAVNLTSSTNWSPAQTPVAGDDLIIGAHTLTLNADMTLNTITLNNASTRLAISGTSRSVQATNGWITSINISGQLITTAIPSGTSVTLTGAWSGTSAILSGIASSTGGDLTLRTVGASTSSVLFADVSGNNARVITSSWTAGILTTIGRFDYLLTASSVTLVSMSGGTWVHSSSGTNTLGTSFTGRICGFSGTSTISWTGSFDSSSPVNGGPLFNIVSSSATHTIGQSGDVFVQKTAVSSNLTILIQVGGGGTVECVGQFTSRGEAFTFYTAAAGTIRYRNQSISIPSTDSLMLSLTYAGGMDISGLVVSNAGKFVVTEYGGATLTASSGTSITNTTSSATACAWGTTALDGKIVTLASSPPTLPSVSNVASGVSYGYTGIMLTGTGIINDPAAIAAAMITSFGSLPQVLVKTTIASLASQTSFTLTAGSADDDTYNDKPLIITDQVTAVQKAVVTILDYTGSSKTVTLSVAPGFVIATGDLVSVIAGASSSGGSSFPGEAPADWLKASGIQDNAITAAKIADNAIDTATFAAGTTIPRVTLADTLTTYTGNTPQTGDSFARLGVNGAGLTALATAAQINSLAVNTRANIQVPIEIEAPDASTQVYKIRLFLFDVEGNMEAPDSTPTLTLVNAAGTSRASRLSAATVVGTGVYAWDYTATAGDAEEQLVWTFTVVEGALTRTYPATSYVVEETAYRFSSSDRSTLQAAATAVALTTLSDAVATKASQASVDDLPTNLELAAALGTADDAVLAAIALEAAKTTDIKTKTDQLVFTTPNKVDATATAELDASVLLRFVTEDTGETTAAPGSVAKLSQGGTGGGTGGWTEEQVTYALAQLALLEMNGSAVVIPAGEFLCTRGDVEQIFGTVSVSKWADLNNTGDVDEIAARINYRITMADNYIRSILDNSAWAMPGVGDLIPSILAYNAASLAGVYLYEARGVQDYNAAGYAQHQLSYHKKNVEDFLKGVLVGSISLKPLSYNITSAAPEAS